MEKDNLFKIDNRKDDPNTDDVRLSSRPNSLLDRPMLKPPHPLLQCFTDSLQQSSETRSERKNTRLDQLQRSLGWRNHYSQSCEYPVSVLDVRFNVCQVQRGEVENTYGTGATVWPASMVLTKYLEKTLCRGERNKRVVDLGAGTGVTSIAAALLLSSSSIVCTDGCDMVVQLAKKNVERLASACLSNGSCWIINQNEIKVQTYQWGDGSLGDIAFDIVLISDCVLPKLYPISPLVDAIDELSGPETITYMSYEQRYYPDFDPREKFFQLANAKNLYVRVVPREEQHHIYSLEDIEIWEVKRKVK